MTGYTAWLEEYTIFCSSANKSICRGQAAYKNLRGRFWRVLRRLFIMRRSLPERIRPATQPLLPTQDLGTTLPVDESHWYRQQKHYSTVLLT